MGIMTWWQVVHYASWQQTHTCRSSQRQTSTLYSVHFVSYWSWCLILEFVLFFIIFRKKHGHCSWAMHCDKILHSSQQNSDWNIFWIRGSTWGQCLTKSTVLKWHAIFVKDMSVIPVCAKPTGWPCLQIMEASEAWSIEATISKKPVVKKLILKLMLAILNEVENK